MDEALRVANGNVAKKQCVDQRENGGIRADSQGEREHRDDRETGILAQDTNGITQILPKVRHEHPPLKIQSWDVLSTFTLTEELFQDARYCAKA